MRSVWRDVDPNADATSIEVSGTVRMPSAVRRIAGGRAKTSVAISAGGSPIPNSNTNGSKYEYAGIVCIASSTGRSKRSTRGLRPAHSPTGMPIASANPTATIISASVSRLASHTPSKPKLRNPAAVRIAIFHPATTPAIIAAVTTSPNQVIRSSTGDRGVEECSESVSDRRQEVDEQRARGAVLDHPIPDVVEDLRDVDHEPLRETRPKEDEADRRDDDRGDGPHDPAHPRVWRCFAARRRWCDRDLDAGWGGDRHG